MSDAIDFAQRDDVKELAERIKLLIPGIQDLDAYKDQGALALAQASITSGLNPFLGEIWVLRRGKSGSPCKGFSIKPGIKGARRAARNQAAGWGLIPPYYRPIFREPSDWEIKLMAAKPGDFAVACDLELLLPPDHPWYKDSGGVPYIVTGLGIQRSGGRSQMAPFQASRKRAEEDALKLAFDLPVYGEEADAPELPDYQAQDPGFGPRETIHRPTETLKTSLPDPVTPVKGPETNGTYIPGDTPTIGPMPDFTQCGPNFWNNLTGDLEKNGVIPSKAWLVDRFRLMGVEAVTEDNAQDLVNQALEKFGEAAPAPADPEAAMLLYEAETEEIIAKAEASEDQEPKAPQVDTQTGVIEVPPRPLSPAACVALVHAKLEKAKAKYEDKPAITSQIDLYTSVIGKLTDHPGEEESLLFYLLFIKKVEMMNRAELSAFFGWCIASEMVDGAYVLDEWAVAEARGIIDMQEETKAKAHDPDAQ